MEGPLPPLGKHPAWPLQCKKIRALAPQSENSTALLAGDFVPNVLNHLCKFVCDDHWCTGTCVQFGGQVVACVSACARFHSDSSIPQIISAKVLCKLGIWMELSGTIM